MEEEEEGGGGVGRDDGEGKEIGGGGKLTDPEEGRGLLGKDLDAPLAALEVDEPIEKEANDEERCWTLGGRSEGRRPCELDLALSPLSSPKAIILSFSSDRHHPFFWPLISL